jgi:hypothetical protein
VVQEIALAKYAEIWCGEHSIPWADFSEAVALFVLVADRVKDRFRLIKPDKFGFIPEFSAHQLVTFTSNVVLRDDEHNVVDKSFSLEYLVSKLTPFEAGEPRDIIYAMLSLAKDVKGAVAADVSTDPWKELDVADIDPSLLKGQDPEHVREVLNKTARHFKVEKFPVNYGKPVLEVCRDFLEWTIRQSKSLDIICRAWGPHLKQMLQDELKEEKLKLRQSIASEKNATTKKELQIESKKRQLKIEKKLKGRMLPSYIRPRTEAPFGPGSHPMNAREDSYRWERKNADSLVGLPGESFYRASRRTTADWHFMYEREREELILSAKGFSFDVLTTVENASTAGGVPHTWLSYRRIEQDLLDSEGDLNDHDSIGLQAISEPFWKTMVAGRASNAHEGKNPPPYYRTLCQKTFGTTDEEQDINLGVLRDGTTNELHRAYLKRVEAVVFRRSLTKLCHSKRLALVPGNSKEGDIVCILYGCSVPVILRKVEDQSVEVVENDLYKETSTKKFLPVYELVGECYVHGMMEGEAFNERLDKVKLDPDFYGVKPFHLC